VPFFLSLRRICLSADLSAVQVTIIKRNGSVAFPSEMMIVEKHFTYKLSFFFEKPRALPATSLQI
jgi:hypothetical protein